MNKTSHNSSSSSTSYFLLFEFLGFHSDVQLMLHVSSEFIHSSFVVQYRVENFLIDVSQSVGICRGVTQIPNVVRSQKTSDSLLHTGIENVQQGFSHNDISGEEFFPREVEKKSGPSVVRGHDSLTLKFVLKIYQFSIRSLHSFILINYPTDEYQLFLSRSEHVWDQVIAKFVEHRCPRMFVFKWYRKVQGKFVGQFFYGFVDLILSCVFQVAKFHHDLQKSKFVVHYLTGFLEVSFCCFEILTRESTLKCGQLLTMSLKFVVLWFIHAWQSVIVCCSRILAYEEVVMTFKFSSVWGEFTSVLLSAFSGFVGFSLKCESKKVISNSRTKGEYFYSRFLRRASYLFFDIIFVFGI